MKKLFLSLILILLAVSAFSQLLKPVKIDSLLTISLPAGFQQKDTLGNQIFSANGSFGYMIAIREPNAKGNKPLKKEKDLNKVLKDYVSGIKKQTPDGSVLNLRDTIIGTLKAKTFTMQTDDGSGSIQSRAYILLYTQDATYTFEYLYPDIRKDLVKDEFKAYFGSIKLSPELQRNDQYLKPTTPGMPVIVKFLIIGLSALVLVVVLIVLRRKKAIEQE